MSTPHPATTSSDIERYIGTHVATLRTGRNLTQEQLADAIGVTKGYVSKIENGHIVPPIGTLVRIAQALQVEITEFLKASGDGYDDAFSIVRTHERRPEVRGASAFGYDYVSLAHKKRHKHMEPFLFTFPTDISSEVRFEHEGEEFLFILSGRVEWEMDIDGSSRKWTLEAGDSLYFESRLPHRGRGLGGEARALIVIYTPQ
jgi:transcriptional regulator with XRE-family HTH domain